MQAAERPRPHTHPGPQACCAREARIPESPSARAAPVPSPLTQGRCLVLVALAAAICYVNTLGNGFVWQDRLFVIGKMGIVESWRQIPQVFVRGLYALKAGGAHEIYYRPLMILSFSLDHAVWGLNAAGYHLTNVLGHVLNALLACLVFRRLLRREAALGGALLFAVHPVHTASVAYVTNRLDVICLAFLLTAFLLLTPGPSAAADVRPRWGRLTAGLLAFALALFAKETAIVLPALLILYAVAARPSQEHRWWRAYRYSAYAVPATIAIGIGYLALRRHVVGAMGLEAPPVSPPSALFWTMLNVLRDNVRVLVWPIRLTTSDAFPIAQTAREGCAWLSGLLAGMLTIGALAGLRRAPAACFGTLWLLCTWLPVANLVPIIYVRSEHFLYIPSFGFALAVAAGWHAALPHLTGRPRARRAALLAAVVILLSLGARTIARNRDWGDEIVLFEKSVATTPYGREAHACLGFAYAEAGRHAEALEAFGRALVEDPRYASFVRPGRVRRGIGQSHLDRNEYDAAWNAFTASLTDEPRNVYAVVGRGNARLAQGRPPAAIAEYQAALDIDPDFAPAWHNLGAAYLENGAHAEAVAAYAREVDLRPDDGAAQFYFGRALEAAGRPDAALRAYTRAQACAPEETEIAAAIARLRALHRPLLNSPPARGRGDQ
jgi:protein O-mannosyl-transferase